MSDKLIIVNNAGEADLEVITRLPLETGVSDGSIDENRLQDLLFRNPQTLPVTAIDPAYEGIVPICRELYTNAGFLDAIYANHLGKLVLVEFKLWRNQQARREVIGQILDYTKEIALWDYEDLQRVVSLNTGMKGNVLYNKVRKEKPDLVEAEFVDNVSRHLKRGEFLLLIVGDGIREGVENIVDFVQRHSGLHFNLALVEAALYRDRSQNLFVHPRVLARTEIVQRFVIEGDVEAVVPVDIDENGDGDDQESPFEQENLRFWNAVLKDYSFSDSTIDLKTTIWPFPPKDSTLYVPVRNSSHNGWALNFVAYLFRKTGAIGCYLSVRKNQTREVRIFEEISASFEDLKIVLGDNLDRWYNTSNRPRIGYYLDCDLSFLSQEVESSDFEYAVSWMRDHLDKLVSHLHPKIQLMLSKEPL